MTPYERGYESFWYEYHTNPYNVGTPSYEDWLDGWQAAYADREKGFDFPEVYDEDHNYTS